MSDTDQPTTADRGSEPAQIHPDEFHPERLNEPACALCGNNARHPVHPTGHEFTPGELTAEQASSLDEVQLSATADQPASEPASEGAQGDESLWRGDVPGLGVMVMRQHGASRGMCWWREEYGPATSEEIVVASAHLARLLNAALAREAGTERRWAAQRAAINVLMGDLRKKWNNEIAVHEETKRALEAARSVLKQCQDDPRIPTELWAVIAAALAKESA